MKCNLIKPYRERPNGQKSKMYFWKKTFILLIYFYRIKMCHFCERDDCYCSFEWNFNWKNIRAIRNPITIIKSIRNCLVTFSFFFHSTHIFPFFHHFPALSIHASCSWIPREARQGTLLWRRAKPSVTWHYFFRFDVYYVVRELIYISVKCCNVSKLNR